MSLNLSFGSTNQYKFGFDVGTTSGCALRNRLTTGGPCSETSKSCFTASSEVSWTGVTDPCAGATGPFRITGAVRAKRRESDRVWQPR